MVIIQVRSLVLRFEGVGLVVEAYLTPKCGRSKGLGWYCLTQTFERAGLVQLHGHSKGLALGWYYLIFKSCWFYTYSKVLIRQSLFLVFFVITQQVKERVQAPLSLRTIQNNNLEWSYKLVILTASSSSCKLFMNSIMVGISTCSLHRIMATAHFVWTAFITLLDLGFAWHHSISRLVTL